MLEKLANTSQTPIYIKTYVHHLLSVNAESVSVSFYHIFEATKVTLLMAEVAPYDIGVLAF